MDAIITLFGEGKDLNVLQMSCRAVLVFFLALIFIRISGRRSFGLHTPLDNIISIALGAVLSRAIVGASPFLPVIIASAVIVLLHRLLGWLTVHHPGLSRLIEGDRRVLYKDGHFINEAMDKALVCEEDIMQGVRKSTGTEDLTNVDKIYMERNGEISTIRKQP